MKQIRIISPRKFILSVASALSFESIIILLYDPVKMSEQIVLQPHLVPSTLSTPPLAMKKNKHLREYIAYALLIALLLVILIIVAVVASRVSSQAPVPIATSPMPSTAKPVETRKESALVESIVLEHMLIHLRQLSSRAMGTDASNNTIDYLVSQLNQSQRFTVQKYYFTVPRFELNGSPIMFAIPNLSNASIFSYPTDFATIDGSSEARDWSPIYGRPLAVVRRMGCSLSDWNTTRPGDVALVRRGNCSFVEKVLMASNVGASACLIYNDGLTLERRGPLNNTRASRNNTIPALFLSYEAGMRLILENTTRIYLRLEFRSVPPAIVTNVCADTKSGDPNRTIVVGSHSDSVAAGLHPV